MLQKHKQVMILYAILTTLLRSYVALTTYYVHVADDEAVTVLHV